MENVVIRERLAKLRAAMQAHQMDFYLIPTADYHHSEYVDGFFKAREYFSGFTGSAGTLVVSMTEAGLWTDGRYFIQAEKEIRGTGVTLFRMLEEGVPTIQEYLKDKMESGQTLGFDGKVVSTALGEELEEILGKKQVSVCYDYDLAQEVWTDRPKLPNHPLLVLEDSLCGKTLAQKVAQVREKMAEKECVYHVLSKLDDLMWLFNIRGKDVTCNPVALSYAFLSMDDIHLFIQQEEITEEANAYFAKNQVTLHGYDEIIPFLKEYSYAGKILLDKKALSFAMYKIASDRTECVNEANPTELLKAIKNDTELENSRRVYIEDSAVLTKFIFKMKQLEDKTSLNEYEAAMMVDNMRREVPGFLDLSFDTICGFKENAAMMHYEATAEDHKQLEPEGMLLVDSGGQYLGGTTDVTRTFAMGTVTEKMKKHFTLVAVGMLRLAAAKFLQGCSGRNLDILARQPLWDMGIDYKCGTGHGIGYILNVHEGPQNIRWRYTAASTDSVLYPGMIVSDEPGVYLEGEYGIRTENILEVVLDEKNGDGQFLSFKMLTYVPIDLDLIDKKWMQPRDIELLNAYHRDVYEKLAPYMNEEELVWLKEATREI